MLARARGRHLRERRAGRRPVGLRLLTLLTCVVAGFMIVTSAIAGQGGDLRPDRTTDLVALVAEQAERNAALTQRLGELRADVDRLGRPSGADPELQPRSDAAAAAAGATPVQGPGVTVTLTDAPLDVQPAGVDEEYLVVHQQDIQAVANALWSGGAEAMTIQGQRVTARTGIKCVGNTVVLHGIPYAPPYVVTAIGDQARLEAALEASGPLATYRQYATMYRLGYAQQRVPSVSMPAYAGSVDGAYARARR